MRPMRTLLGGCGGGTRPRPEVAVPTTRPDQLYGAVTAAVLSPKGHSIKLYFMTITRSKRPIWRVEAALARRRAVE
ncbi:hypothetical protein EVAR_4397_1 [Eumeta japonica]|uniref:Uncharacterized protein n=1 Tax=Eumeta variegata TaxID=151549 RepID=A0A4C1SYF5_EUMVA|nr:hypothetical protein EVAR_4397_1 [Eumeta japonica]